MARDINLYSPQTGRRIKEDNSIVNTADMIEAIYNKIVNGQVDMQLSGSNVLHGKVQNVAIAGTRVQLPNLPCREVTIIAKRSNTGTIYVGGSDVSATVYGADLLALDSITLKVNNTNLIWIDASVNGEGITYVAI